MDGAGCRLERHALQGVFVEQRGRFRALHTLVDRAEVILPQERGAPLGTSLQAGLPEQDEGGQGRQTAYPGPLSTFFRWKCGAGRRAFTTL